MKRLFLFLTCALAFSLASRAQRNLAERDTIDFGMSAMATSTREINALAIDGNGALWAATNGGVLRRAKDGKWTKWTRENGLPANEVRAIQIAPNEVLVRTPRGSSVFQFEPKIETLPSQISTEQWKLSRQRGGEKSVISWNGARVSITTDGLKLTSKSSTRLVAVPGNGTHISALWPRAKTLLAASFGDDVYEFDGAKWRSLNLQLPLPVRDITALCEDASQRILWIGTRRAGVWRCDLTTRQVTQSSSHDAEPVDHNAQAMAAFDGRLWISTLENGLVNFDGKAWGSSTIPQISTVAPRQMVVFGKALWLRHGDGQVDKWDGATWKKDVFAALPRRKVFALTADGTHLIAVQWGGWSAWDGAQWTHHFEVPQLQNVPVVSALLDEQTLWLGTQNRGLIEYSMPRKTARVHDERDGLPDDWITTLAKVGDEIYAGTFVGGVARWNGAQWKTQPELKGENVTAIESAEVEESANNGAKKNDIQHSRAIIATRNGVWKTQSDGSAKPFVAASVEPEVQTLLQTSQGLWIGARTGLSFVRTPSNVTILENSAP